MHTNIRLEADIAVTPPEAVILDMALQALDTTDNPVVNNVKAGVRAIIKGFEQSLTPEAMKQMRELAGVATVSDLIE